MLIQLHEYLLTYPRAGAAEERVGTGDCLCAEELDGADALLRRRRSVDRQQRDREVAAGFAVGRNNWTFFGSDNGGKTAAVLRSFVTSCELAKVDPFAWFRDVLGRIAEHPIKRLEELLPHRWAQASQ